MARDGPTSLRVPSSVHTPPRKHLCRREFADGYRFVTFSCYRQLPLLGTPRLRKAFTDAVRAAASRPAWRLLAYAVMPEHVHMVARTQGQPLGEILNSIKSSVANRVLRHWRAVNAPILDRLAHPSGGYRFWQHGGGVVPGDPLRTRQSRRSRPSAAARGLGVVQPSVVDGAPRVD